MTVLQRPSIDPSKREAYYALAILTSINLLNYMDRYIPSATKELFKKDLNLSDAQTSIPLLTFLIVYMLTGPLFAHFADKGVNRKVLLASGIIVWSAATGAAYFSVDFWSFLAFRTLVGVGEAAYATIAPVLISDFFPPHQRSTAFTIFYSAIPVGAALGFQLGSVIGGRFGWRMAFLAIGSPGLLVALLIFRIKDPGRGVFDTEEDKVQIGWIKSLGLLVKNRMFVTSVLGYILVTFGVGGMADWLPTYFQRNEGVSIQVAGTISGAATVVGGITGTLLGGFCAEKLKGRTRQPYFALCSCCVFAASMLMVIILFVRNIFAAAPITVLAQMLLWSYNGPINAIVANVIPASYRARAFSLQNLCIHLLGDAISPVIIGAISDASGSLTLAVSLVPISIALGSLVWGIGWRILEEPAVSVGAQVTKRDSENGLLADNDLDQQAEHSDVFLQTDSIIALEEINETPSL
eukprot:TRINITY_DN1699_c0_g1_i1.p1 TRINITY_DN1699_c0_g1~~TRINITY_DN1699_c0_g1_i1.p1  ORF type:complete len:466 (+),score=49.40 TRINITY_DN1699_c0_g1_i1:224-1621(+)